MQLCAEEAKKASKSPSKTVLPIAPCVIQLTSERTAKTTGHMAKVSTYTSEGWVAGDTRGHALAKALELARSVYGFEASAITIL